MGRIVSFFLSLGVVMGLASAVPSAQAVTTTTVHHHKSGSRPHSTHKARRHACDRDEHAAGAWQGRKDAPRGGASSLLRAFHRRLLRRDRHHRRRQHRRRRSRGARRSHRRSREYERNGGRDRSQHRPHSRHGEPETCALQRRGALLDDQGFGRAGGAARGASSPRTPW